MLCRLVLAVRHQTLNFVRLRGAAPTEIVDQVARMVKQTRETQQWDTVFDVFGDEWGLRYVVIELSDEIGACHPPDWMLNAFLRSAVSKRNSTQTSCWTGTFGLGREYLVLILWRFILACLFFGNSCQRSIIAISADQRPQPCSQPISSNKHSKTKI